MDSVTCYWLGVIALLAVTVNYVDPRAHPLVVRRTILLKLSLVCLGMLGVGLALLMLRLLAEHQLYVPLVGALLALAAVGCTALVWGARDFGLEDREVAAA